LHLSGLTGGNLGKAKHSLQGNNSNNYKDYQNKMINNLNNYNSNNNSTYGNQDIPINHKDNNICNY
jgi:hypothetical protein